MVNGQSLVSVLRKPSPVWEKSTVRHQEKLSNPERQGPFFIRLSYKTERLPFCFLSDKKVAEKRQKSSCSSHH